MYGVTQRKPFVFTYLQDRVEVVGGPSCCPATELYNAACNSDGVPVHERRGGGGTVVLAPGMVVTIVVDERPSGVPATGIFNMIHGCMILLLEQAGMRGVSRCGISDLAVDERKILGSSLYMGNRPFLYYYQSSLIVDVDLGLLDRYLRHPPREPAYRRGRPHRSFCTSLAREKCAITSGAIRNLFDTHLADRITAAKTTLFPS